jgi:hypothetical protein
MIKILYTKDGTTEIDTDGMTLAELENMGFTDAIQEREMLDLIEDLTDEEKNSTLGKLVLKLCEKRGIQLS